jgi:imidazolonepropionase-like amidohydrolase
MRLDSVLESLSVVGSLWGALTGPQVCPVNTYAGPGAGYEVIWSPGAAAVTAFVDVNVVPMDSERVLPGQTVVVQGGRITALGPSPQVPVPAGAVRIDGRGQFLIPGLADMHAHIFSPGFVRRNRGFDSTQAEYLLLRFLVQGTTTIRSLDYKYQSKAEAEFGQRLKARVAAGQLLGPRVYNAIQAREVQSLSPDSLRQVIKGYKAAGYDFFKVHGSGVDYIRSLAAASRQVGGPPVVGHWPTGGTWDQGLASGIQSIEHVHQWPAALLGPSSLDPDQFLAAMHRAALDSTKVKPAWSLAPPDTVQARLAAMRRAGVWFSPTFIRHFDRATLNWRPQTAHWMAGKDTAVLRQLIQAQPLKLLYDAGVGLLLSTDDQPEDIHLELQVLVKHGGLTPYQALVIGTRNIATYLGTLAETGTIAVGKRADLVLLRGNPLTDIRNTKHPAGVMLGGRWLPRAELDRLTAKPPP